MFKNISTIIRYTLVLSLFSILTMPSFLLYSATYGKTLIFQLLIGIAFVLYLIMLLKNEGKIKIELTPVFFVVLIYLFVRLVTGFFGLDVGKSFWGNQSWSMGSFTWVYFFIFFFLLTQFFKTKKDWFFLFKISLIVSFFVAITGVLQRFDISLFDWWGEAKRISGIIGSPIPFAGYIMFNIWIGYLVLYENTKEAIADFKVNKNFDLLLQPMFWLVVLVVNNIVLFWSGTLGVIYIYLLSIPLLVFAFIFLYLGKNKQKYVLVISLIFLLIAIFFWFTGGSEFLKELLISRSTLETRILNWEIALHGWTESVKAFLIGHGPANYDRVFDKYYNPEFLRYSFYETVGDRAHNIFLEVANASGLFGVISYFLIFVSAFIVLILGFVKNKIPKSYLVFISLAFLTYLGQNMIEFDTFATVLMFFFLLAFVSFVSKKIINTREIENIHIFIPFVLIVLLLITGFIGLIKPIKASYYGLKAKYTLLGEEERWGEFAQKALNSGSVYQDEIRVLIANDAFQLHGKNILNISNSNVEALKLLHKKLGESVLDHPVTYAYKHRYAQIESIMGEFMDKKYFEDAENTFNELYLENPDRQAVVLAWAQTKVLNNDIDGAVNILQETVNRFPEYDEIRWYLGLILYDFVDKEQGKMELEKSLELGGYALENSINIDYITGIWEENKEYEKIINLYAELTKNKKLPLAPTWLTRLAATYAKIGDYDKAIEAVEEAVELDPRLVDQAREFINLLPTQ